MTIAYYDTTYLLKLQMAEAGTPEVRAHAETVFEIHSAHHGRAEFASAAFRKVREGVATPADYQRLFPFVNAGEESAPRVSDLSSLGFPGDDAWAAQDFCGGLGGSGCSAAVRDKLLADPF